MIWKIGLFYQLFKLDPGYSGDVSSFYSWTSDKKICVNYQYQYFYYFVPVFTCSSLNQVKIAIELKIHFTRLMNIKRLNNHLFNLPRLRFSVVFSTVHEILSIVVPQNDVNIIQAGRYPRPSGDTSLTSHNPFKLNSPRFGRFDFGKVCDYHRNVVYRYIYLGAPARVLELGVVCWLAANFQRAVVYYG